jgi:5-methylthioadenosine/S-adenosylhomocysteine deaminase
MPDTPTRTMLEGRVVTMDDTFRVLKRGLVAIENGRIVAVQPANAPPPPGFETALRLRTRGTLYPGLMDLHNHLSYNALTLWDVPKKFSNRGQWGGIAEYRKLVSGPMAVLGRTPGYVEAIVRYVEAKCLLGGVTTSQGIALFSNQGISRYYRGVVRNAEQTTEPDLPDANTSIADVEAKDVTKFFLRLQATSCLLLHLSEGVDDAARKHFLALQLPDGGWAITDALAGIHSAGLKPQDFAILGSKGGAMIWSPLSNLLLYGGTADVKAAKENGVRIGIGADWSPSGSKNLLGELKIARLVSQTQGGIFTDRELVAMATRTAAKILKWDASLGSLESGKRADITVVRGTSGDPYAHLLTALETDIHLVVIDGEPRYGTPRLMQPFGKGTENWKIGRAKRVLNLALPDADPAIGNLSLKAAQTRLRDGLQRLPELAERLENPPPAPAIEAETAPHWYLVLDQDVTEGEVTQTLLPFGPQDAPTGFLPETPVLAAAVPLSTLLVPLELDPLTAAEDPNFLPRLQAQRNLPDAIKSRLADMF